mgnify:CR=1 FL=1
MSDRWTTETIVRLFDESDRWKKATGVSCPEVAELMLKRLRQERDRASEWQQEIQGWREATMCTSPIAAQRMMETLRERAGEAKHG